MSAALADFAPDWPVVLEVAAAGDKDALDVRAGADGDTPLHAAAYWGELEAIGAWRRRQRRRRAAAVALGC